MAPGEIYLANFPFGGLPGVKLRPVLLLAGPIGTIPEIHAQIRRLAAEARLQVAGDAQGRGHNQ